MVFQGLPYIDQSDYENQADYWSDSGIYKIVMDYYAVLGQKWISLFKNSSFVVKILKTFHYKADDITQMKQYPFHLPIK